MCITEADEMKLVLTQNHGCLHVVGFSRDVKAACKCILNLLYARFSSFVLQKDLLQ